MNRQDIRDIYDYNYWANGLLLATAEKITQVNEREVRKQTCGVR